MIRYLLCDPLNARLVVPPLPSALGFAGLGDCGHRVHRLLGLRVGRHARGRAGWLETRLPDERVSELREHRCCYSTGNAGSASGSAIARFM